MAGTAGSALRQAKALVGRGGVRTVEVFERTWAADAKWPTDETLVVFSGAAA